MDKMNIHRFDSLESTNKYCELLDLSEVGEFSVFWAIEQTAGIGQRGNHWHSQSGKNLTFSIVLHPSFLVSANQFRLTQVLSLGVSDFLKDAFRGERRDDLANAVSIKWPNDIYVETSKICGMLVENRLSGATVRSSICGIGLNVNQTIFPDWIPNPVSMSQLTHETFDLETELHHLIDSISHRYRQLQDDEAMQIEQDYLSRLLNMGIKSRYRYKGEDIEATITGVTPQGHLTLIDSSGNPIVCDLKEIQFLF